ncbi:UDP-N-acetylglucosamine 4,6-dehydratase (inverting) [Methanobacterium formicicum]|uniref:dTDP-D-glucose 4,6-dehydratase n=1 Tax=Methanobacterium formicicum (strain DSM 3637 / PP1) TaxID=1204725 RepID=K2RTD0_METFP|nr:UDP-N-acetylglucosamine 4,6-dehydratase (inverting) [Methanobacterium formicicum]EKF86040.1 dTDP-D-glucose 4,6-dehydratase [Methanobacterium formicicum DSM 3637]
MLNDKVILITGGTGSFGKKFVGRVLRNYNPKKIIIYSRDEYKQFLMQKEFKGYNDKLRFFIGDVRDKNRLYRAFEGVDIVIHAAALKQIPAAEYNPLEAVKTNIYGAENIIDAAIDKKVKKIVALSTDKAVNPINLYGATKLVSDKLFISGNAYVGSEDISFSVVRYGNVAGSRGSIIPFFQSIAEEGNLKFPITDFRMTRFWITLDEAVDMVLKALDVSNGGEIFVRKCPSFKISDLAKSIKQDVEFDEIGIRPGEKIHEMMITEEDSRNTYEHDDHFVIYPDLDWWWRFNSSKKTGGKKVKEGFRYSSGDNKEWLDSEDLRKLIDSMDIV